MPVSRTATVTPSPENGDVSAPTAGMPHAMLDAVGCDRLGEARPDAMSFIGNDRRDGLDVGAAAQLGGVARRSATPPRP